MNSKTYSAMIAREFGGLMRDELKKKLDKLIDLTKREAQYSGKNKMVKMMDQWLGIDQKVKTVQMVDGVEGLINRRSIEDPVTVKFNRSDFVDRTPRYIGVDARIEQIKAGKNWFARIKAEREAKRKAEVVEKLPEFTINGDKVKRFNRDCHYQRYQLGHLETILNQTI